MNRGACYFIFGISLLACGSAPVAPNAPPPPPPAAPPPVAPMVAPAMDPAPPPLAPVVDDPPRELPPLSKVAPCRNAVVLLFDRSGSMSGAPIDMAKDAMAATLKNLDERDCYGVITFDSTATRFIPLAPLKDREVVKKRIAQITPAGGTDIRAALDAGAREILAAEASARRGLVLLTDGQSPSGGIKELAASLRREYVVVSTIGIGNGIDEGLLRMIADESGGRYRKVTNVQKLPEALPDEVARLITRDRASPSR